MSDGAFRPSSPVKRVPRMPRSADTFTPPFVHNPCRVNPPGPSVQVNHRHVREPLYERCSLSTPGVLGSGRSYVVSSPHRVLRPHPSVSQARGDFASSAYTPRLRCAGTPRRPARPSLLSLLHCPHVPSTIRRWVRNALPLSWRPDTRLPQLHKESPPTVARLCQPSVTGEACRRCIVRVMLRPVRLPRPPGWLRRVRS